ncbi:MAG: aldo/keto reductase [Verrucomicrobiales bacterium]|jgi:aryl-alcohol dehydrogenase-like predicted oxidoreductase|nr:aldo/keto reductase [Verrucomicrobiales bacterium]|tara:strand:- start:21085 stop:21879 length:795 start_codon:yes stop_codon:yes gene_type:complete
MNQRPIHTTDIMVSSLGLGTVKFGRNQQVKYPKPFELPSDKEICTLLDLAQELGINLLDTAPAYGISEERLGRLLGSRRDHWVIMSKAGEEFLDGRSFFDFSPEGITKSVDRTLLRLNTDRIESLLLHSDGNDLQILNESGAVDALFALKDEGKILSTGISTKTVQGGLRAIELGLDSVMVTYNPWHTAEESILEAAEESGTSVFVKKALGSGWFDKESTEDSVETSFRFIFEQPASTSIITGTVNPRHLHENVEAMLRAESES